MSSSPATKHNFACFGRGPLNAAPDSLLRTQNGYGVGSSSRPILASWKQGKKHQDTHSPNHLGGFIVDPCCHNDSVGRDVPPRAPVFSFDRVVYDFCYAEGSAERTFFECPSYAKMPGQLLSGTNGRIAARLNSKNTINKPFQVGATATPKTQLRLISLFEEDENASEKPEEVRSRKIKANTGSQAAQPLLLKKDVCTPTPKANTWKRTFEEDYISQYLKIEPDLEPPVLGKRASNLLGIQPPLGDHQPFKCLPQQVAIKAHPRPSQVCTLPSALVTGGAKSIVSPKEKDTSMLPSLPLHSQRSQYHQPTAKPQNQGLVIHTGDPDDFYSDSESQQKQTYELSIAEITEMQTAYAKAALESGLAGLCCKLEESAESFGLFSREPVELNEIFPRLLLPAITSTDYSTNHTLEKGSWLPATRDSGICETLHITPDAEVFNPQRLEAYFNQQLQLNLTKKNQRAYLCKYCGIIFKSGCALGGHISKIHRGVNLDYSIKMKHRRESKAERERSRFLKQVINLQK